LVLDEKAHPDSHIRCTTFKGALMTFEKLRIECAPYGSTNIVYTL